MKKIILISLVIGICLIFLPQAFADLNDGLEAYYPFNGNANDESGNGSHGIVNGANLTEDRFGNSNSAYLFDGANDYISLNSNVGNPPSGTVIAWANAYS